MKWVWLIAIFSFLFIGVFAQSEKKISKKSYVVVVRLMDGSDKFGVLHSFTDSHLHFSDTDGVMSIPAENIYQFNIRKENSIKRNALIGAGVGFAIGFILGFNSDNADIHSDMARTGYAAGAGLIGAFSGLFIGHVTGTIGKTYHVFGNSEQYKRIQPDLLKYNQAQSD